MTRQTHRIPVLAIVLAAAIGLSACNQAEPVFGTAVTEDVLETRRFAKLLSDAENGVVDKQYRLGRAYERGEGAPRDLAKARQWYLAAAQAGYVRAMRPLGDLYMEGEGGPTNPSRARFWYERAVNNGDAIAGYRIASNYLDPDNGSPPNVTRGLRYLQTAARGGYVPAQLDLAELYEKGELIPQDRAEATRWYSIARTALQNEAADDDATALQRLGDVYRDGKGVAASGEKAAEFYEKAANLGRTSALLRLARLYDRGTGGIEQNPAKAVDYFQRASDAGNMFAAYSLARKYASGDGVAADGQKAFILFERVASNGDTRAYAKIGELLADADVDPTNYLAALDWLERAARIGDGKSMYNMGKVLEEQMPRATSQAEILSWYLLARDHGYSRAGREIDRLWGVVGGAERDEARNLAEAFKQETETSST